MIAGIQVQEAVKWLHRDRGLPLLAGRGFVFNGPTHDPAVVGSPAARGLSGARAHRVRSRKRHFGGQTPVGRDALEFVAQRRSWRRCWEFYRELCTAFFPASALRRAVRCLPAVADRQRCSLSHCGECPRAGADLMPSTVQSDYLE